MAVLEVGRRLILSPPKTINYRKLCLALHPQIRFGMQIALSEINRSSGISRPTDGTLREPVVLSRLDSASPSTVVDRRARWIRISSVSHEMNPKAFTRGGL
jgi:hypothetical protein